jgi:hypothetical protein
MASKQIPALILAGILWPGAAGVYPLSAQDRPAPADHLAFEVASIKLARVGAPGTDHSAPQLSLRAVR